MRWKLKKGRGIDIDDKIIFFDTETTGLPDWKTPSGSEHQPHIVQLGIILADTESHKQISAINVIIKPEGWMIPKEMSDIHGITHEMAMDCGVKETTAINMLLEIWRESKARVCHNRTFDQRIIRIALKRYQYSDNVIDLWAGKDSFQCTMLMSKPIMKLPPRGKRGYKNPRLEEAYRFFTGKKLKNAHSAMADTEACMEVFWGIKRYTPGSGFKKAVNESR